MRSHISIIIFLSFTFNIALGNPVNEFTVPARPIFFVSPGRAFYAQDSNQPRCQEFIDLQNRLDIALKRCQSEFFKGYSDDANRIEQKIADLNKRFMAIAATIGQKLGACAVFTTEAPRGTSVYIDPIYDITDKVIEELNKSYVPKADNRSPEDILYDAILIDSEVDAHKTLELGIDLNKPIKGKSPLFWAVVSKKRTMIKFLLKYGAKPNNELLQLALNNDDGKSAILLAKGCGVNLNNVYSYYGREMTLLQVAATVGDLELVLELIKSWVEFSAYTKIDNHRTLMDVVAHGNSAVATELIQILISRDYKVNDIWSCSSIYPSGSNTISIFIKNGANVNHIIQTNQGSSTPLFKAIEARNEELVKILLDAGADTNLKASPLKGELISPLSFAIKNNNPISVIELLIKYGAKE